MEIKMTIKCGLNQQFRVTNNTFNAIIKRNGFHGVQFILQVFVKKITPNEACIHLEATESINY